MKIAKTVKIRYKGKDYFIESEKALYVLAKLSDEPLNCNNEKELRALLREYRLYDEVFLNSINSAIQV